MRALTGRQQAADNLITLTLESMVQNQIGYGGGSNGVGLFRAFSSLCASSLELMNESKSEEHSDYIFRKLKQLAPLHRQVFLLAAMEEFSSTEIAEILNTDVANVWQLQTQVSIALADIIKTRVLIIEDEVFIAQDVSSLFGSIGHEIVGVARTSSEAVALAKTSRPGLIIADIQLLDGSSGLAAVNEILDFISAPVIFVTAFPERFLTTPHPEPSFLISKPFQPAMLLAVASQALFFKRDARRRVRP